ncbi:hypothetical protein ACP70R_005471 [Stipagrostis hirtigluma subsp. patula]
MVLCGTGSFKDVDKEAADAAGGGGARPPAAAKKAGGKKGKGNPYATRGLDKFSTVLSELESRRERILRRVGPGDAEHLMVRFVQSEAKGWVPIVVKLPPEQDATKREGEAKKSKQQQAAAAPATPPTEPGSPKEAEDAGAKHGVPAAKAAPARNRKKAGGEGWPWSSAGRKAMRPLQYWPLAAALLLLSLVVFGRVFAICCTSIWWYLLPILTGDEGVQGVTRSPAAKVRKDLGKKASEKFSTAAAPPSHGKKSSSGAAANEVISPRSHAHRKKG